MKDILSFSLTEHIQNLSKKDYSSYELTLSCLKIIEETANINAFITTAPEEALKRAKESDLRRLSGCLLSELDGIPFGAKDNISAKGMPLTCASRILAGYIAPYDATVIARLKDKGAILVGKTNLDEFAMGDSTESSVFGATLNPLDSSRVAGGSSGGSAAAVCARQVPFALGSDTGGSVRQPSAFCGTVGMRSTYGSVSRYGLVSFAPSFDIIGAITRNLLDNAIVTSHICGIDEKDATSFSLQDDLRKDIGKGVRGMKIALLSEIPEVTVSNDVLDAMKASAARLRELGAEVEEISLKYASSAYASYYTLVCAEASSNLARFDGVRYGLRANQYTNTDELYQATRSSGFGKEPKRRMLFGAMALSAEHRSILYDRACNMRRLIGHELSSVMSTYDAILMPSATSPAYEINSNPNFEMRNSDIFCCLASLSGMPSISVPIKAEGALPIGVQLMGAHCTEAKLYCIASALEGGSV